MKWSMAGIGMVLGIWISLLLGGPFGPPQIVWTALGALVAIVGAIRERP